MLTSVVAASRSTSGARLGDRGVGGIELDQRLLVLALGPQLRRRSRLLIVGREERRHARRIDRAPGEGRPVIADTTRDTGGHGELIETLPRVGRHVERPVLARVGDCGKRPLELAAQLLHVRHALRTRGDRRLEPLGVAGDHLAQRDPRRGTQLVHLGDKALEIHRGSVERGRHLGIAGPGELGARGRSRRAAHGGDDSGRAERDQQRQGEPGDPGDEGAQHAHDAEGSGSGAAPRSGISTIAPPTIRLPAAPGPSASGAGGSARPPSAGARTRSRPRHCRAARCCRA